MGVRNRNKGSPPSTPSSAYSGSRESSEHAPSNALGDTKSGLKRFRRPPRPTHAMIMSLLVIATISVSSFLISYSVLHRQPTVRSLQGSLRNSRVFSDAYSTVFPRIVFLEGAAFEMRRNRTIDTVMIATESTQPVPSDKPHLKGCVPLADWMTDSYPNCNSFHEMHLPQSIAWNSTWKSVENDRLDLLGRGWFRSTWQWDRDSESSVLKTLRLEREFLNEYYDLHNRDALAMERLTASPNVVDVYGYCGQSAINELADFPIEDMQYLEKLSRRLRGMYDHESLILRLGIAASIARGLADVHRAGGDGRPSMTHYDINPRNVALFRGARAKINDFNIAEFTYINPTTNKTCGFPSRMHAPWWRAPEEVGNNEQVLLDEKVDIYSLGSTLFHLLTSFSPRGKMVPSREEMVREWVKNGKRPVLMPMLRNSTDPIAQTFRDVIDRCHERDPSERPSSNEVAIILEAALEKEKGLKSSEKIQPDLRQRKMNLANPVDGESEDSNEGVLENKG